MINYLSSQEFLLWLLRALRGSTFMLSWIPVTSVCINFRILNLNSRFEGVYTESKYELTVE